MAEPEGEGGIADSFRNSLARMARKRHHKPGDLTQLRRVLWDIILQVEALHLGREPPPEMVLKCAHALSQLAGSYTRLVETEELLPRIERLEAHIHERNGHR
jgi:hypothetical protein